MGYVKSLTIVSVLILALLHLSTIDMIMALFVKCYLLWYSYSYLCKNVAASEYWKGKGKSQPIIHLGGTN
jgi:hypothetical protein